MTVWIYTRYSFVLKDVEHNSWTVTQIQGYCSRTFLVHHVERLLPSVMGGSQPSVKNFTASFHPRNRYW